MVAISGALWLISDRAGTVGPFDRASFGWIVVVPIWLLAPFAAVLAAGRLSTASARRALVATAAILGLSVALAVATSLTASVEACSTGARGTELIAVVAVVAGTGAALGLVLGAAFVQRTSGAGGGMRSGGAVGAGGVGRAGRLVRGLVAGAAADLVALAVTVLLVSPSAMAIGCQRPLPS